MQLCLSDVFSPLTESRNKNTHRMISAQKGDMYSLFFFFSSFKQLWTHAQGLTTPQQITRKQLQDYKTQLMIAEALTCSLNESSALITLSLHYSSNTAPGAPLRSAGRGWNMYQRPTLSDASMQMFQVQFFQQILQQPWDSRQEPESAADRNITSSSLVQVLSACREHAGFVFPPHCDAEL